MSEPDESASPGWLVVLPLEVSDEALERIRGESLARGWSVDDSRGAEQVILAFQGPRGAEELGGLLAGLDADVLPLLPVEHYRRQHARRRFLSALVAGLGLMIAAGIGLPLFSYLQPPSVPIVAPDLLRVAGRDEIVAGGALLAHFHGQPILVIRVAQRGWQALLARCTYPGDCLLAWDAPSRQIVCPCHGCRFDAQGNVLHPPASTPLLRLEVLELDGGLFVRSLL